MVKIDIVPWPTSTACYLCERTDVRAVCHHCGRPICRSHLPRIYDSEGRLLSQEHTGLGLERTPCGEAPLHCRDCDHQVRPVRLGLLLPGAVAIVGGRFLQQELPDVGLAAIVLGALALAAGAATCVRRWWALRSHRATMPWVPKLRELALAEALDGTICLDPAGEYRSDVLRCEGRVRFEAALGETERHVFECCAERFGSREDEDLPFRVGFLVLGGRACLDFDDEQPLLPGTPNVLPLDGSTSEAAAQRAVRHNRSASWVRAWTYRPEPRGVGTSLPVQVVPSVLPESGGRKLSLEVRWGPDDSRDGEDRLVPPPTDLKAVLLERLELRYPLEWGEVEAFGERVQTSIVTISGQPVRQVLWRKVVIQGAHAEARRRRFEIRFEQPIDLATTLEGGVAIDFRGGLTGVGEVRWFYPSGEDSGRTAATTTRVEASFSLALRSLRHREVRLVPDSKRQDEHELAKPLRIDGVVPDHGTVIAVGRALAEHGCYLKSVVEDRPRSGTAPGSVNRLWDLAGRVDDRIASPEFHLALSGEEQADGRGGIEGRTRVTLSVQGAYCDRAQEEAVRSRWDGLVGTVERALRARTLDATRAGEEWP